MEIDAVKLLQEQPVAGTKLFASGESLQSLAVEPAEPITLERAKQHLRVVFDDEDDYILSLIIAARMMAEGRLNRTLVQRKLVETFTYWDSSIRLSKPPIQSVDNVEVLESGLMEVTYTAGYAPGEVPQPIIQWMLLTIGTMYDNRASVVNGVSSQPLGDDFARWLLQPYMVYE